MIPPSIGRAAGTAELFVMMGAIRSTNATASDNIDLFCRTGQTRMVKNLELSLTSKIDCKNECTARSGEAITVRQHPLAGTEQILPQKPSHPDLGHLARRENSPLYLPENTFRKTGFRHALLFGRAV